MIPVSSSVSTHTHTHAHAHTHTHTQDYKPEWDPKIFKSEKTGRGELKPDWKETSRPIMCAYKLVECEFKWFGLQGTVESRIQKVCVCVCVCVCACVCVAALPREIPFII